MPGAEVRYRGYRVGRVSNIDTESEYIKVDFYVDSDAKIPKGSILRVVFDGLIGEKYISIMPDPKLSSNKEYAKSGAILYGYSTSGLADFVDVATQNLQETKAIVSSLREVLTADDVNFALKNMLLKFDKILTKVDRIVQVIDNEKMGSNFSTITADVSNITNDLKSLVTSVKDKEMVEKFDQIVNNLAMFTDQLNPNAENPNIFTGVQKFGNTLSRMKLSNEVDFRYSPNKKETNVNAYFDLFIDEEFFRLGVGNYNQGLKLLHIQKGIFISNSFYSRVGMLYGDLGVGFDWKLNRSLKISLNLFDMNDLQSEIITNYAIGRNVSLSAGISKDRLTGSFEKYSVGFNYHN